MKVNNFFLLLIPFLLLSCNKEEVIYQSEYKFKRDSWNSFEKARYRFIVENTSAKYDLYLNIIYTSDYPRENITFASQISTPSGEERIRNFHLRLRTKDEIYKAYEKEEVFEKRLMLGKDYTFKEKGACIVRLENRMSKMETAGVRGIELEVIRH